jgi:hypothetical protein
LSQPATQFSLASASPSASTDEVQSKLSMSPVHELIVITKVTFSALCTSAHLLLQHHDALEQHLPNQSSASS